jgi:hypothetical protein
LKASVILIEFFSSHFHLAYISSKWISIKVESLEGSISFFSSRLAIQFYQEIDNIPFELEPLKKKRSHCVEGLY